MAEPAAIPEILDPVFDYLSQYLPPTVLTIIESLVANTLTLIYSLFNLVVALITDAPNKWDTEKILPPLITLLISYLALVSFYRTTGWMLRTAFAFLKWGFILSSLAGMAGYMLANSNNGNGGANGVMDILKGAAGMMPAVGSMLLSMFSGNGNGNPNSQSGGGRRGGRRTGTSASTSSSSTRKNRNPKPKVYDSWESHSQWQYTENTRQQADGADVQKVVSNILGTAKQYVMDSGFWETAKGMMDEITAGAQEASRKQETRKETKEAKTSKSKSKSR